MQPLVLGAREEIGCNVRLSEISYPDYQGNIVLGMQCRLCSSEQPSHLQMCAVFLTLP